MHGGDGALLLGGQREDGSRWGDRPQLWRRGRCRCRKVAGRASPASTLQVTNCVRASGLRA